MLRRWNALHPAARYILPRLIALPLLWWATATLVFLLLYVIGDPYPSYVISPNPPSDIQRALEQRGLLDPNWDQYRDWMGELLRADLGTSFRTRAPVSDILREGYGETLTLVIGAIVVALGLGLAVESVRRAYAPQSTALANAYAAFALAVPLFVVVTVAIIYPAVWWNYAPPAAPASLSDGPLDLLKTHAYGWFGIGIMASPIVLFVLSRSRQPMDPLSLVVAAVTSLPLVLSGTIVAEVLTSRLALGGTLWYSFVTFDVPPARVLATLFLGISLTAWLWLPRRPLSRDARTEASTTAYRLRLTWPLVAAACVLIGLTLFAFIGPVIWDHDPRQLDPLGRFAGPSLSHPFGTNRLGQDVLARTMVALRADLTTVAIALAFGFLPGALAIALLRRVTPSPSELFIGEVRMFLWFLPILPAAVLLLTAFERFDASPRITGALIAFAFGLASTSAFNMFESRDRFIAAVVPSLALAAAANLLVLVTTDFIGFIPLDWGLAKEISSSLQYAATDHAWLYPAAVLTAMLFALFLLAFSLHDDPTATTDNDTPTDPGPTPEPAP